MGKVIAFPKAGDVFCDARGDDRTMRVSRHDEQGMVVVSLWSGKQCRASFRLPLAEVPRLAETLQGIAAAEPVEPAEEPSSEEIELKPDRRHWWQRFVA